MINLQDFITKYTGQYIPFTNCESGQCMALMHAYISEVFGLTDPTILATPSAYQVYSNFANLNGSQYFTPIANTPLGVPNPGDIGVISANEGGALADGHVFVVVKADENQVQGFSQNWPSGSPAELRSFTYVGLNWLSPKSQGEFLTDAEYEKLVQESIAFEAFITSGYSTPNDITSKLSTYESQITSLQKQVGDLTQSNEALQLEVQQNKNAVATMADLTQQQAGTDSAAIDEGLTAQNQLKEITTDITTVAQELATTYPPVSNLTTAIQNLQNQLKAAQIALTKQAQINAALQKSQQQTQAVVTASKGFFSKIIGWFWVSK